MVPVRVTLFELIRSAVSHLYMKSLLVLGALLLSASPALSLPARLLCHENDGVAIYEANELMEYFEKKG